MAYVKMVLRSLVLLEPDDVLDLRVTVGDIVRGEALERTNALREGDEIKARMDSMKNYHERG